MSSNLPVPTELIKLRELNRRTPIVALPPELLSEVFLECIDRGAVSTFDPQLSVSVVRRVRTSLASVCHQWRQVAQATKPLWAVTSFPHYVITFDDEDDPYLIPSETYECFHHELELAGGAPLTLISQITLDEFDDPSLMVPLERDLCTALSPVLSRCHRIIFDVPDEISIGIIDVVPEQLGNTKSLHIRAWGDEIEGSEEGDTIPKILDLSHANSIEDLYIDFSSQYDSPVPLITASPRLGQPRKLKHLALLGRVEPSAAYNIISQALSLHSLAWTGSDSSPLFTIPPQQMQMPFLRYLGLGQVGTVSLDSYLDAPGILYLVLKDSHEHVDPPPLPVPSRFRHIRSLSLESVIYTCSPLLPPLVPEFPALEVLILRGVMSVELASACNRAAKLRLLVATWPTNDPSKWIGAQHLLDQWSSRVDDQDTPPVSRGFCFVHHLNLPKGKRRLFTQRFPKKYPKIQIGLHPCHPFEHWRLEDWDEFFALVDANPSYLPPF
ncbi:hypothetical protein DL93DRAFT_2216698 [Clavulina sp. PMI_390]|nr:hypothetical protein DL93DRAFT_2216698 [Clavulina sp. PMI_390]